MQKTGNKGRQGNWEVILKVQKTGNKGRQGNWEVILNVVGFFCFFLCLIAEYMYAYFVNFLYAVLF